jgi:Tol biopolymer transport system component
VRLAALLIVPLLLCLPACGGEDEAERDDDPKLTGPPTLLFAASGGGGASWDVWQQDVASGKRTNLTNTPSQGRVEADDKGPAISQDGTLIAYTSTADHTSDGVMDEEIYVMARDGSGQRRLTENGDVDVDPQWTPAGRILFTTCPSVRGAISKCGLDLIWPNGTGRRTAIPDIGLASGVALAAAGDRIALTGLDEQLRPNGLMVLDLASGDEQRIADGFDAAWSPDGERIAFFSGRDRNGPCLFGECTGNAAELYVVDSDGSGEERLTETPAHEDFAGWTPDGEWILFSRIEDEDGGYDLYAVRADGECEIRLTDTEEWEWSASWLGSTDSLAC